MQKQSASPNRLQAAFYKSSVGLPPGIPLDAALIIEFFLDFYHDAVFQSKRIRLDEQPFVFLRGGGKVPPCFERIQPVLARAIFLLDIVDRDGCVRVYLVV